LPPTKIGVSEEISAEIVSFAWQDLLPRVADNTVDMIISSVTASKKRESDFQVIFGVGYYVTHQMLLANQSEYEQSRSLFENIKNKRIGAVKGTTNERAAYYLANKCSCGIDIKAEYVELIESKNALFKKEIDLLLTDDIWVTGQSNLATFKQYGPELDGFLADFYSTEYGRPREEYAIAFSRKGGDEIMEVINDILKSDKAKLVVESAEAKARSSQVQTIEGTDRSPTALRARTAN